MSIKSCYNQKEYLEAILAKGSPIGASIEDLKHPEKSELKSGTVYKSWLDLYCLCMHWIEEGGVKGFGEGKLRDKLNEYRDSNETNKRMFEFWTSKDNIDLYKKIQKGALKAAHDGTKLSNKSTLYISQEEIDWFANLSKKSFTQEELRERAKKKAADKAKGLNFPDNRIGYSKSTTTHLYTTDEVKLLFTLYVHTRLSSDSLTSNILSCDLSTIKLLKQYANLDCSRIKHYLELDMYTEHEELKITPLTPCVRHNGSYKTYSKEEFDEFKNTLDNGTYKERVKIAERFMMYPGQFMKVTPFRYKDGTKMTETYTKVRLDWFDDIPVGDRTIPIEGHYDKDKTMFVGDLYNTGLFIEKHLKKERVSKKKVTIYTRYHVHYLPNEGYGSSYSYGFDDDDNYYEVYDDYGFDSSYGDYSSGSSFGNGWSSVSYDIMDDDPYKWDRDETYIYEREVPASSSGKHYCLSCGKLLRESTTKMRGTKKNQINKCKYCDECSKAMAKKSKAERMKRYRDKKKAEQVLENNNKEL